MLISTPELQTSDWQNFLAGFQYLDSPSNSFCEDGALQMLAGSYHAFPSPWFLSVSLKCKYLTMFVQIFFKKNTSLLKVKHVSLVLDKVS